MNITRYGNGTKLYVTDLSPEVKLDTQGVTKGQTSVATADATRLEDRFRRQEPAGPLMPPTYEVLLFWAGGPLPIKVGEQHRFRLVAPAGRDETKGPEDEFDGYLASASGPGFSNDATPQIVTLTIQASGEVQETPASREVVA